MNPLRELQKHGQSVWLDYIRRDLIASGALKRLIEQDGLRGMTSNPSIFEKGVSDSDVYRDLLDDPESRRLSPMALYEKIAIRDIRDAADALRPVYEQTRKRDGYVSLEVSPFLANDTQATLEEARRLWKTVARPNVMIKVPGTPAGMPAIRQLVGEGLNINITLLFAQSAYEQVAAAYLHGLQTLAAAGKDLSGVAGVASFFVSRIDTLVDKKIEAKVKGVSDAKEQTRLRGLLGKVAIANAKQTYQRYLKIFSGPRWQALAAKGAQTQRVLWASTSTKNPNYRDVLYVEELIGHDTVNTMPPATLEAFREHGAVRLSLTDNLAEADRVMEDLAQAGISMKEVTDQLVSEGVQLFADAFEKLLQAVQRSAVTA